MSLHLTGEAAALITKLMGSTNRLVLLTVTGISLVQFVCIRGVTSTGWHLVTYTVAPFRVTWCPLPNIWMRLYGFSAPAMLSSLNCAICLLFSQISPFTCRMRSCSVIVAFTCRKLSSDSSLVMLASVVAASNLPDAT